MPSTPPARIRVPRLIACDVDGTLLSGRAGAPGAGTGKVILPRTRAVLDAARAAGSRLALVSGRPIHGLRLLVDVLDLDPEGLVLIGLNGSVVARAETGEITWHTPIAPDLYARLLAHARGFDVTLMVSEGDAVYAEDPAGHKVAEEPAGNDQRLVIVDRLEDLGVDVHKVVISAPAETLQPLRAELSAPFAGELEFSCSVPYYFEATAPGVDKGSALARLCAETGIDLADVIAFGDNENDIEMLRAAGLGVAMGNAIPAAQAAADRVTAGNDEDGIALVLEEWFSG